MANGSKTFQANLKSGKTLASSLMCVAYGKDNAARIAAARFPCATISCRLLERFRNV